MGEEDMLDFVLCDDNFNVLTKLENTLETIFIDRNFDARIALSTTLPEELLNYIKNNTVHVVILDIDLKSKISGLDLANMIRNKDKNIYIIFTTGHLEYGLMAYKYKTFDYIPKPITRGRLEDTVTRLFEDVSGCKTDFVRLDHNKTIIKQDTIQYIQKDGMKTIFHTDTREYETYSSFKSIMQQLPEQFMQCHKSYIVNVSKIVSIDSANNTVILDNKVPCSKCYIGPKYKNKLMEVFNHGNFSNNLDSNNNAK